MSPSTWRSAALIAAVLVSASDTRALAQTQTDKDKGGFTVRELSVSSGYAFVDLPPITLGGYLPNQIFQEDLVTSGTAAIDWSHVTNRALYNLNLFGTYTARTKYSELNAPAANLSFGATRALGRRWQVGAGIASGVASSDQLAAQPASARRLVDDATSFDQLAGAVAVVRSPYPDLAQASLFTPINQSFDASEINGTRSLVSAAKVGVTYVSSVRFSTHVTGAYTIVRDISSRDETRSATLTAVDADAQSAGVGIRYGASERTQITADVAYSQTEGVTTNKVVSATVGYGWSGRKWFGRATVGVGLRPFELPAGTANETNTGKPVPIYSGSIGYKFRTHTLLGTYTRTPHDDYGHGGRNPITGFDGDVQSVAGSWSWIPPRSRWTSRADLSFTRRPGNFSYIPAWFATVGVGRQLSPNLRVMGEVLFDRHGSRSFEGFNLTTQSVRINLIWTPFRRAIESESAGQ